MPLLVPKKRRTSRNVGLEPTSRWASWLPRVFREREIFVPSFIGLLAVIAMVFAIQGWRPIFPYRVGSRADRAIYPRISFRRINQSATEKAKAEAEKAVKPVFVHDPKKLESLPARFRTHLAAVAKAKNLTGLPADVKLAFGLKDQKPKDNKSNKKQPSPGETFLKLKQAVGDEAGMSGTGVSTLVKQLESFIAPLAVTGRVDPTEITKLKREPGDPIQVVQQDNADSPLSALPSDVVLKEALLDSARLGSTWQQHPAIFALRRPVTNWLLTQVPVTLKYDDEATNAARKQAVAQVEPEYDVYEVTQPLTQAGQVIDEETQAILRAEYRKYESDLPWSQRIGRASTTLVLLLLLALLMGYYLVRNEPELVRSHIRLGIYVSALVVAVFLGRLLAPGAWRAEVIPLAVTVMVFAVAYNQRLALMTALTLSLLLTLTTTADLTHFVVLLSVSSAMVLSLSEVPSRSSIIKVGFAAAIVYFIMSWSTEVVWNQATESSWADTQVLLTSLRGAGCCLVAGYLVAGSLPFIESAFGVVTDISLLEMSDVSHPLLQELARRAPGTYNHSISVATMGEAAADAIGANGLLLRVAAYFHDIGKMLKPEYFIENVAAGTESRHKKLAPAMSTLIIIGHVKDGVDLAKQHNLPQRLIDFIEQHHGTTLVEYFYHEAAKQAEAQPDHKTDAEESSFRYPGPKPQTKEAGVMMLADSVESASRTLSDPTAKRIESLVKSITMKKLLDDQFDECSLTLSEIRIVEESLIKSLIAIYHGRVKYPEQRTA